MSMIAVRYAQALFECASEQGKLKQVGQDLATLQTLISTSQEFDRFLGNPLISKTIIREVFGALWEKLIFSDLTLKFIELLAYQKRLKNLGDIARHFGELLRVQSNTLEVHISSATLLNQIQLQSLKNLLKSKLKKEIIIHEKIDAETIGGIIIHVGEYLIDSTICTQLDKLQKVMRA